MRGHTCLRSWSLTLLASLSLPALPGCSHRASGEINVDEVQGYVNDVEKHLRAMRTALRAKDLGKAQDEYKEAREVYDGNHASLANYPEIGELNTSVKEAEATLCFGCVNISLEKAFESVRAKDLSEARDRLAKAQKEFNRCEPLIDKLDDFVALKMNLDTAPQALAALEREINRPALLEKIHSFQQELAPRLAAIREKVAALEKQPNQKVVVGDLDGEIQAIRTTLDGKKDFGDDPEWVGYLTATKKELDAIVVRCGSSIRRGKLLRTANELLPAATRQATQAAIQRKPEEAIKLMTAVAGTYKDCVDMVAAVLKEEPGLAKFTFNYLGAKRTPDWLQRHCASERQRTQRLVDRLSGKKSEPEKAPEATPPPAPADQKVPDQPAADPNAQKPPPKKTHRNKRW